MLTVKKILLEQLTVCYDENGWFVALKNALCNLTAQQAAWRPEMLDNSIWGIVSHLNFYNERYLRRFGGEAVPPSMLDNSETFSPRENSKTFADKAVSEADWQAEIEKFEALMDGWQQALEAADEEKLAQTVSAENQSPWSEIIAHINLHNAHHGGQIVLIRKLQGSWDASKGVS